MTSTPVGIDCGTTCTAAFSDDVVLTATASPGSVFVGWSDASCTSATCSVPAASLPASITATFSTTDVTFTPPSADFGPRSPGVGYLEYLTLQNSGDVAVPIESITVSGPYFSIYPLVASSQCDTTLAAMSSCTVDVSFDASVATGIETATVDVVVAGEDYTAQVQGTALVVAVTVVGDGTVTSVPGGD